MAALTYLQIMSKFYIYYNVYVTIVDTSVVDSFKRNYYGNVYNETVSATKYPHAILPSPTPT